MTLTRTLLTALLLAGPLAPAFAQGNAFPGVYRLWDRPGDGAPAAAKLQVIPKPEGGYELVRTDLSRAEGDPLRSLFTREVTCQDGVLQGTYRVTVGGGLVAHFGPQPGGAVTHELVGRYRLRSDMVLEELLENRTRRAPETWAQRRCRGLRTGQTGGAQPEPRVYTVVDHGPPDRRFDLAFVAEGYTKNELPRFREHVARALDALRTTTPWKEYWRYLNVHVVETVSALPLGPDPRPSALGTSIPAGKFPMPRVDQGRCRRAAEKAPGRDVVAVLGNGHFRSFAGDDFCITSTSNERFQLTLLHELGHAVGRLLDEYTEGEDTFWDVVGANGLTEWGIGLSGWGGNVTTHESRDQVPWRHWLPRGVPLPTPAGSGHAIGLYQGAYHTQRGWYRPAERCMMRSQWEHPHYCPVCREKLVIKLSERVMPITASFRRVDKETFELSVQLQGIPGRPQVAWARNGHRVMTGPTTVRVRKQDITYGSDTVIDCVVEDTTPWVRADEAGRTLFRARFVVQRGFIFDPTFEVHGPRYERGAPTRPERDAFGF